MKPYEKYVPSGVEWIGDIPEGWKVKKFKYLGQAIIGLTYSPENVVFSEDDGTLVLRSSNIQNGELSFEDNVFVDMEISDYLIVQENDLLICSRNGSRALIGKNALIPKFALKRTFGAFMTVFRSKHNRFIKHVLNSDLFEFQADSCMTTTVNQLTIGNLNNMKIPFPDVDTQQAIVDYLDRETARINNIIKAKETLIERLKEKRTALTTHAVTRGLDSNAKMKPSGIDWIGDIPEEWEVKKLKYISLVNRKVLGEDTSPDYEFKYVDIGSVTLEDGITEYTELIFDNAPSRARRLVKQGDTIVSTVRTYLKAIAKIDDARDVVVSTGFAVIEPTLIDADFFSYALKSELFVNVVSANSVGVSYPAINATDIMQIIIVYPKDKEMQKDIAAFLKKEIEQMNLSISKTKLSIEKLKEYRIALISACVTGKLDVRGV